MKVWELMAKLATFPAGHDVIIAVELLRGPEGTPECHLEDLGCTLTENGPNVQLHVTVEGVDE